MMYDAYDEFAADELFLESDYYDFDLEPCDDEMGFDPYEGCYTWDC